MENSYEAVGSSIYLGFLSLYILDIALYTMHVYKILHT
jgi:hypothetical protein